MKHRHIAMQTESLSTFWRTKLEKFTEQRRWSEHMIKKQQISTFFFDRSCPILYFCVIFTDFRSLSLVRCFPDLYFIGSVSFLLEDAVTYLCLYGCFIGLIVAFWLKWAPTSGSSIRFMRPVKFDGPGRI